MSRPLKKPKYDKRKITNELLQEITSAYGVPYDDRECGMEHSPALREVADQFDISPIRMRKLLITAGVYSTERSRAIAGFIESGFSIDEIQRKMNLSRASIHSYIPYSKTIYKLPERSTNAERTVLYRERMRLVKELQEYLSSHIACDENKAVCELVWSMIIAFEGYTFQTYKGLRFQYQVRGKELFVNRKEKSKSITKSSIDLALAEALQLRKQGITGYGPKKLKVFGSSYLWAMFKRFGLLVLL